MASEYRVWLDRLGDDLRDPILASFKEAHASTSSSALTQLHVGQYTFQDRYAITSNCSSTSTMRPDKPRILPPHLRPKGPERDSRDGGKDEQISLEAALSNELPQTEQACDQEEVYWPVAISPAKPPSDAISTGPFDNAAAHNDGAETRRLTQPVDSSCAEHRSLHKSPEIEQPTTRKSFLSPPATRNSKEPAAQHDMQERDHHYSASHGTSSIATPKADLVVGLLGRNAIMSKPKRTKASLRHRVQISPARRWVKSSEIPKGENSKKKKKAKWAAVDARSRLSGWLTKSEVVVKGGDPASTRRKSSWNGPEPPELDWDDRKRFEDSQLQKTVDEWRHTSARAWRAYDLLIVLQDDLATSLDTTQSSGLKGWLGAVVPPYWMPPSNLEQLPRDKFWKKLKASRLDPIDDGDLDEVIPWWKQCHPQTSPFCQIFEQPKLRGIDPDETMVQTQARLEDKGSNHAVAVRREAAEKKATKRTTKAQLPRSSSIRFSSTSTRKAPKRETYIRAANREDIPHICAIYNHYVSFSLVSDEIEEISEDTAYQRWRKAQLAGLPMIVACDMSYTIKDRRKVARGRQITIPETVVGFAFLSDYEIRREVYKHTKRMQVFTHPEHYLRGIGKCLVDKLLELVDCSYTSQTDCTAQVDGQVIRSKDIRSLVVPYLYDTSSPEQFNVVSRWLTSMYKFAQASIVPNIGWKHDKKLSLAIFQRGVGEPVNGVSSQADFW